MRGAGVVILLGAAGAVGCTFEEGQYGEGGTAAPGDPIDEEPGDLDPADEAGGGTGEGSGEVPPELRSTECEDPTVILCFDFEDEGPDGLRDGSTYDHDVQVSGDVAHVPGKDGDAVLFSPSLAVSIPETDILDVSAFSLAMWIRPSEIPSAGRAGLLDNDAQYGLFLYPDGEVRCSPGGARSGSGAIQADAWYHVACTVDEAEVRLFVDGVEVDNNDGSAPSTAGDSGSAVGMNSPAGDHFLGLIDSLRLWNTVLSPDEICTRSGRSDCSDVEEEE